MKIAILGAAGTIGRFLASSLPNCVPVTRNELNLLDEEAVRSFLKQGKFDIVINAAINSECKMTPFNAQIASENLKMFSNLYSARSYFDKLINFGSGAEFDRSRDINNAAEWNLYKANPVDHYGMSKNFCSRIALDTDRFYTLRLFGVFHPLEAETKLLPKILLQKPTVIEDKYFDYLFLEDLLPVVQHYIDVTWPLYKDINVVYPEKIKLSEFVNQFCTLHNLKNPVVSIVNGLNYTGDASKITGLELPKHGLTKGLKSYAPLISKLS